MLKPVVLLVTLLALDVFAKKKKKRRRGGMDALAAFTTAAKPPSRTGVPRRPLSLACCGIGERQPRRFGRARAQAATRLQASLHRRPGLADEARRRRVGQRRSTSPGGPHRPKGWADERRRPRAGGGVAPLHRRPARRHRLSALPRRLQRQHNSPAAAPALSASLPGSSRE